MSNRPTQIDVSNRASGVVGTTQQTFAYDAAGRKSASTDNNDPSDATD